MSPKIWLYVTGFLAAGLFALGCKTPAQVYEEKEVRNQPIEVKTEEKGPTSVAEIVRAQPTAYAGRTLTVKGVVSGILNPHALTLRGPGPDLLVLIPGQVALAPGRTSTQPYKLQDTVQVTGSIKTFSVAQLAPGLYALVPPTNRTAWANRPVVVASDLVYIDLPYTAVSAGPTGVQVAKSPSAGK